MSIIYRSGMEKKDALTELPIQSVSSKRGTRNYPETELDEPNQKFPRDENYESNVPRKQITVIEKSNQSDEKNSQSTEKSLITMKNDQIPHMLNRKIVTVLETFIDMKVFDFSNPSNFAIVKPAGVGKTCIDEVSNYFLGVSVIPFPNAISADDGKWVVPMFLKEPLDKDWFYFESISHDKFHPSKIYTYTVRSLISLGLVKPSSFTYFPNQVPKTVSGFPVLVSSRNLSIQAGYPRISQVGPRMCWNLLMNTSEEAIATSANTAVQILVYVPFDMKFNCPTVSHGEAIQRNEIFTRVTSAVCGLDTSEEKISVKFKANFKVKDDNVIVIHQGSDWSAHVYKWSTVVNDKGDGKENLMQKIFNQERRFQVLYEITGAYFCEGKNGKPPSVSAVTNVLAICSSRTNDAFVPIEAFLAKASIQQLDV